MWRSACQLVWSLSSATSPAWILLLCILLTHAFTAHSNVGSSYMYSYYWNAGHHREKLARDASPAKILTACTKSVTGFTVYQVPHGWLSNRRSKKCIKMYNNAVTLNYQNYAATCCFKPKGRGHRFIHSICTTYQTIGSQSRRS